MRDLCGDDITRHQVGKKSRGTLALRQASGKQCDALTLLLAKADDLESNGLADTGDHGDILDAFGRAAPDCLLAFDNTAHTAKINVQAHAVVAQQRGRF